MDEVLTTMAVFWALMLLTYFLMQNGLSIFNDVAKSMGMFMLEKALGPAIDLVEGRPGSASKAWFMQGLLWLLAASTLTFEGLWLMHEPAALHSLSAWGYNPTSDSLLYAGNYAVLYGGIGMLLIGAGLHILPRLARTELASEKNAVLVSFLWTLSVMVLVIGAHDSVVLGVDIIFLGTAMHVLAFFAVVINQLLTVSKRQGALAIPGWLIIFGLLADPVATAATFISGSIETGVGQWLLGHMVGGTFFFASAAGVALYAASSATGNPLWSKSLAAAVLVGSMATINPMGEIDGRMAADMLGLSLGDFQFTTEDNLVAAFLMALATIPIMALAANVLITLRGGDAFVENPDSTGTAELNLGASMLLPLAIGSMFIQSDAFAASPELSGLAPSLMLIGIWLVFVPISLGAALHLFPAVTGRHLLSRNRARWAFWMMGGGAFLGLTVTMMADMIDMALIEATVGDPSSLAGELRVVGAVLFYGTVVGAVLHTLNAVSGLFRGTRVDSERETSSSLSPESYSLASPTSVRRILASGANLETTVVPVGESDDAGSATEL